MNCYDAEAIKQLEADIDKILFGPFGKTRGHQDGRCPNCFTTLQGLDVIDKHTCSSCGAEFCSPPCVQAHGPLRCHDEIERDREL